MRIRSFVPTAVALSALCAPTTSCGEERPRPRVDVEVVSTGVYDGKVDLFALITNPNDFDVYVARGGGGSIFGERSNIMSDGPPASDPEDFLLVPANSKRLSQVHRGLALEKGVNRLRVKVAGRIDPKAKLPWNYIPLPSRELEVVISNE